MPEYKEDGAEKTTEGLTSEPEARRAFLKKAGRFAAVTPPSITLLLGTSLSSRAIAKSNGSHPGHGWGDKNHTHHHKSHGRSGSGGGKHKR